ncbi:MAG: GDP-mannose 4,6-dehydratase [Actinomycetes bacterium]
MRALITGGKGFVGQWLARHLEAEGDEVHLVDLETDVADPDAIGPVIAGINPDAVYHLAALSHVGASWDAPTQVAHVNVVGTTAVLAAARSALAQPTVLFVSSAEVYGSVQPAQLPLSELSAVQPTTPYAASKAAAEQIALGCHRGFGQKVIVVRPFNHIGPGQAPVFAVPALAKRMVEAVASGQQSIKVGNLSARRDFTDVRDVVRAYRLLVTSGTPGEIYNIASGVDVGIDEIVELLLAEVGASLGTEVDPELLRPIDIPILRGDIAKLASATGWSPEIPLAQTVSDIVQAFR